MLAGTRLPAVTGEETNLELSSMYQVFDSVTGEETNLKLSSM